MLICSNYIYPVFTLPPQDPLPQWPTSFKAPPKRHARRRLSTPPLVPDSEEDRRSSASSGGTEDLPSPTPQPAALAPDASLLALPEDEMVELFSGVFSPRTPILPRTISEVTICFFAVHGLFSVARTGGKFLSGGGKPVLWDLAVVDAMFASGRFPLLKKDSVKVEIDMFKPCEEDVVAVQDAVAEALPRLRAASMLAFVLPKV